MNFTEFKQKVINFLKDDGKDDEEEPIKYSFRDSFQGKMLEIVIGYAITLLFMTALVPSMLTESIKIINSEMTFSFLLMLSLVGYVSIMCFQTMGCWVLDRVYIIWDDVKDRVKPAQIIMDSLLMIVVFGYIAFKLLYPYIITNIR